MKYQYGVRMKRELLGAGIVAIAGVFFVSSILVSGSINNGSAMAKAVTDVSVCNTAGIMDQWDVTFPDGTIKAGVNPQFSIFEGNHCAGQFNARIISVSTGYIYDNAGNRIPSGFTRREVSRDIVVKPGFATLTNRLGEHSVNQVTQMVTEMTLYMSSSFDANGQLLPNATPLASDTANWTQTNFRTQ